MQCSTVVYYKRAASWLHGISIEKNMHRQMVLHYIYKNAAGQYLKNKQAEIGLYLEQQSEIGVVKTVATIGP
jgi:hypothetical protein